MNRLFVRALLTILGALAILVVLLTASTALGLQRSIGVWDRARTGQLEALAGQILRDRPDVVSVPGDAPLFVYDAEGRLIYSNRGEGARRRAAEQMNPVLVDGRLLGYYHAEEMFRSDAANNRFLESLRRRFWAGLGLSLAIAAAFALLFSRSLSAPAARVAGALERISGGDLASEVEEGGTREIALIAVSANRLRRRLAREQEQRRQWVHDITHDLRTPVAALRAQFEGMRDGVLEISQGRVEIVLREVTRVQELVVDLEELMRLESPEMRLSLGLIETRALVQEARERFEQAARAKAIDLRTEARAESFRADAALIQRALSNLLANALRHCPARGSVAIAVERLERFVILRVTNTGDPIPPQDLERVFDRLFRGESARNSPGSGLGLTIAQRIAQLHGGEVSIANRSGGVVVELRLPQPPASV